MRHSTRNVLLLGFCGCLLLFTGCGGSEPPTVASTDTADEPASPSAAPANENEPPPPSSKAPAEGSSDAESSSDGESGGGEEPPGNAGFPGDEMDGGASYAEEEPYGEEEVYGGEEVYGEDAYAGEPGYAGRSRSSGNSFLDQLNAKLAGMITPTIAQVANPAGATGGPPKSFLDRAAEAFAAGNEPLARNLYLMHLIGEFDEADQAFAETQFSSILKRPVWAMQWGASVHVRFSGNGDQEIHPVREEMPSPMGDLGARRGSRPRAGGRAYGESAGGGPEQEYAMESEESMGPGSSAMDGFGQPGDSATSQGFAAADVDLSEQLGLVAQVTSEMFGRRLSSGAYGSAFVAYGRQSPVAAADDVPAERPGRRVPGNGMASYAEVSNATGEYEALSVMGETGGGYAIEPDGGYAMEPDGGYGMQPDGPRGRPNGPEAGAMVEPRRSVPAAELPRWRPGVIFVGEMNSTDALAKAQENSLDFLIHFDVAVRTSPSGSAKNITRIRVYPAAASRPIVTSKPIDNYEVYKLAEAERKTERESVEEVVSNLFEILDEKMVMRPMPTLNREVAQERVISLVASANEDVLRALAEIRLYQWQQSLDQEEVATAFHMTAGDNGLTVLHGLPEARQEVLESYLDASP